MLLVSMLMKTMLLLWMAIYAISYVTSPIVGRIIDRIGERPVMVFYFACLTVFFTGYAVITNRHMLYAVYVIDSAFFVLTLGLKTYVNRIAPKEEHTATLTMGVAMNHVAAVLMPFIGAIVWKYAGYQWAFVLGAVAAAASILAALRLPSGPAVHAPAGIETDA